MKPKRQPGQDVRLARADGRRDIRVPCNGTVILLRADRARPLVGDASIVRDGDLVLAMNLTRLQADAWTLAWLRESAR